MTSPPDGLFDVPRRHTTTFTANMNQAVHRWFRYSAGFSAQWAGDVIAENGAKRVLDPFAGSGTTLLAAQAQGVESYGVDVHPFVAQVARVKLHWTSDAAAFEDHARTALRESKGRPVNLDAASELTRKVFPDTESLIDLLAIRDTLREMNTDSPADQLAWLALMSILRRCSPVGTAQWQYVLPNKSKARVSLPHVAFEEQVRNMADDMRARQFVLPEPVKAHFVEGDIRTTGKVPDHWADLVLTSPPYANNFDYADAVRLEMTFVGEVKSWADLGPLRQKLIRSCSQQMARFTGDEVIEKAVELEPIRDELRTVYEELGVVRLTKAGRKAYHSMVVAYFHDMAVTWLQLRRMTADGGRVCYVVGDSAPYGVYVPVERWLGELALSAGFKSWRFDKVRDRNNKWENRKHRVPLHEGLLWVEA